MTEMELLGVSNHMLEQRYIPAERLSRFGSIEQTNFKKHVYEIHRQNAISNKRSFVGSLPEEKLDYVYKKGKVKLIPLRKEAVASCRLLLKAAERDLSEEKLRRPLQVSFWVQSGYRSANDQFSTWDSNFSKYYRETQKTRERMDGGEHGEKAAKYLASYIGVRLASPGYSLHNNGLAIDFVTIENGKKYKIKTSASRELENAWRKTWLFAWLSKNASSFGFFQNKQIDEPWHYEYRQVFPANKEVSISSSATNQLPGETIYAPIDLTTRNYSDKHRLTGIYIPVSFIRGSKATANVIIYLHGYKKGYPDETATIREYWDRKRFPLFAFREELAKSRKNAILIAPTLGPRSQSGRLVDVNEGGGLDWYVAQILDILRKRGIANEINEVVLACHSGGGSPMLKLAIGNNKSKNIECWAFDSLYSGYNRKITPPQKLFTQSLTWLSWANKYPNRRLYVYYHNSTKEESKKLLDKYQKPKADNIFVEELDISKARTKALSKTKYGIGYHYYVPITYFLERILKLPWS